MFKILTGDGKYIKEINRKIILKNIMEHKEISRSALAKRTGLNKATISVQVNDLVKDSLVYETQKKTTSIGRRPILLTINQDAAYFLGIDLDYGSIQFAISNLKGKVIETKEININTEDIEEIIKILASIINLYIDKYAEKGQGVVNAVIGIHGTVNKNELVHFVPKFQWKDFDLKNQLLKFCDIDLYIENNANLATVAESVYQYQTSNNLMSIILRSGVGAGNVIDRKLQQGYLGYFGEMGHMIVQPRGEVCNCGNFGCWELYASEPSLYRQLSKRLNKEIKTQEDFQDLVDNNYTEIKDIMDNFFYYLTLGINNIINLFNPETLVLNSKILSTYPNSLDIITSSLKSTVSNFKSIELSELSNSACLMGACGYGIQQFVDFEELFLEKD